MHEVELLRLGRGLEQVLITDELVVHFDDLLFQRCIGKANLLQRVHGCLRLGNELLLNFIVGTL